MIVRIDVPLGMAAYAMGSAPLRRLPRDERKHRLDMWSAVLRVTTSTLLFGIF